MAALSGQLEQGVTSTKFFKVPDAFGILLLLGNCIFQIRMIFKGIYRGLVKAQTGINIDAEELNLSSVLVKENVKGGTPSPYWTGESSRVLLRRDSLITKTIVFYTQTKKELCQVW